ncbi:MAG TPA: hypothetical protein VJ385_22160 [Fibrobacteria bacterium]|nr:hypothetical protein [Fibrobacteria bacterium]
MNAGSGNAGNWKTAVLDNPYLPLCVPPVIVLLQFLVAAALFDHGLPESMMVYHTPAALMITGFFALSALAVPALLLGVRNVIYNSNKVAPALGILANLVYLVTFVAFFVLFFVVKTVN